MELLGRGVADTPWYLRHRLGALCSSEARLSAQMVWLLPPS